MGTLTDKCSITIGGKKYEDYNFSGIMLSQKLLSPCELRFTMKKGLTDTISDSSFPVPKELMGKEVECVIHTIRFDEEDKQVHESLEFMGYVFNVHINRSSDLFSEQLIDVQAYSYDYLLIDHPHCFSYEEMTLKDIVTKTLHPYPIPNVINPRTKAAIPYTVQYNESNYQFLIRLALRYGEWMYHDGKQWIFGEIQNQPAIHLEPRNDMLNYNYQTVLLHHKVKHAHHDYLKYENLSKSDSDFPDLTAPKYHTLTDATKEKSAALFTKETFQHLRCSNPEVNSIDELEVSVKVQLFGEKTHQVVCRGSTVRADLTIGSKITICDHFYDTDNHATIEHDELIITEITHKTEVDGHYSNTFTAYPAKSKYPHYYQSDVFPLSPPQRAKVMDNKDPEALGRIRVQFLWQQEQDPALMTPWIRIAQPHGGENKGFYFIPEINEEVMVDFENANAEKPFIVGTLYHGKQHPGKPWPTDANDIKAIRTRNGHTIEIHDEGIDGYIKIYDHEKENYILTFSTDEKLIKLESTGNIELYAVNDIILHAQNDIVQKADHCRLSTIAELDSVSSKAHNYVAGGLIYMEGNEFYATGKQQATLDSNSLTQIQSDSTTNVLGNSTVLVGSGGSMEVSAGSVMELNADATIDIKASAPMTLGAPVIKIN